MWQVAGSGAGVDTVETLEDSVIFEQKKKHAADGRIGSARFSAVKRQTLQTCQA